MKAKTLTGEIDTDKLSDIDAAIVELVETNPLRKAGNDMQFSYFIWGHNPKSKNYCVFSMPNGQEIFSMVNTLDSVIKTITKGNYGAMLVKLGEDGSVSGDGEEWKNPTPA